MPAINFFTEETSFQLKQKNKYKKWIKEIITQENHTLNELNFIFCSDKYLLQINKEYLNHNYFTDIITFDNSLQKADILGDIFISIDTVRKNSVEYNTTFQSEISRVIIHGVLHLLGYGDKSKADKALMRKKEDLALSSLLKAKQ